MRYIVSLPGDELLEFYFVTFMPFDNTIMYFFIANE